MIENNLGKGENVLVSFLKDAIEEADKLHKRHMKLLHEIERLEKENEKYQKFFDIAIDDSGCPMNIRQLLEEVHELRVKVENKNDYQRKLESKIIRLKDRVKTFEKHYSMKDIERYKKMDNPKCITYERLKRYKNAL